MYDDDIMIPNPEPSVEEPVYSFVGTPVIPVDMGNIPAYELIPMEVHKYVQVNLETGIVEAISFIEGDVDVDNLILVPDDFDATNKMYLLGEWVEYIPDPVPEVTTPKTNAELEAENELLKAQVAALSDQLDFQEECLVEMASIVYA